MTRKFMVVAAHPDDEVLGCGGTIARLASEGNEIYCLFLGEGVTSRYTGRGKAVEDKLKRLKREAEQAAAILGIKKVFFQDFPDNRFDTVPLLTLVKAVEQVKGEIKPEIVYTHHRGDLNIDHRITYQAVLTACRPVRGETVREIYSFEVPSSTGWAAPDANDYFMPNVFMDITETLGSKLEALEAYKGEIGKFPHPRSPEALRALAMRWGSLVGCEAAEAFVLTRAIR